MTRANGVVLDVDLSALIANYRLLKKRHAKQALAAVVKADAYGLGAEAVSRALWQEGCRDFFVATLEEAIELRGYLAQAGIAVFNGLAPGEEKTYQQHNLTPVLGTLEQVECWRGVASLASSILHVDTGMTRLGLSHSDVVQLVERVPKPKFFQVMSHLACANDSVHPKNQEQLQRFKEALALLPGNAMSFANSSGLFLPPEFHFDIGRPGCALYGINPLMEKNPMRHVATLTAPILQLRTLDRDETVGYGATYPAKKGGRIAIIAFGYADGALRALSNKAFATVCGVKAPYAGRVSMDMIAIDVSDVPERKLKADTRVELINETHTVSDVAVWAGTIGYELFTRLGKRVVRRYL